MQKKRQGQRAVGSSGAHANRMSGALFCPTFPTAQINLNPERNCCRNKFKLSGVNMFLYMCMRGHTMWDLLLRRGFIIHKSILCVGMRRKNQAASSLRGRHAFTGKEGRRLRSALDGCS